MCTLPNFLASLIYSCFSPSYRLQYIPSLITVTTLVPSQPLPCLTSSLFTLPHSDTAFLSSLTSLSSHIIPVYALYLSFPFPLRSILYVFLSPSTPLNPPCTPDRPSTSTHTSLDTLHPLISPFFFLLFPHNLPSLSSHTLNEYTQYLSPLIPPLPSLSTHLLNEYPHIPRPFYIP